MKHSAPIPDMPSAYSPRPSAFVRAGVAAYLLLIVYASWYPFTGWKDVGMPLLPLLLAPWPHYWTGFDVATNVVGYVPFGGLLVFSLYPRVRGWQAMLLAVAGGIFVSGLMEAGQVYLPNRVPSNLDWITNSCGTVIGAVAGMRLSPVFLEPGRLYLLRQHWFAHHASRGLIVLALWPLAQIYPQPYLLGLGQIVPVLSDLLSYLLSTPVDLGDLLRYGAHLTVEQFWLAETIITACGLTGAVLTLLCLLRKAAPKAWLAAGFVAAAIIVKSLAHALIFAPQNAFSWLTPGATGGLLIGIMMLSGLGYVQPPVQRRLAVFMLLLSLAVVNLVPANPYFTVTLQTWIQGKFLNFNGAAQFLSLFWPFLALSFLIHTTPPLRHK